MPSSGGVQGANAAARLQSRERRRAAGLTVDQDPREALLRYATEAEAASRTVRASEVFAV